MDKTRAVVTSKHQSQSVLCIHCSLVESVPSVVVRCESLLRLIPRESIIVKRSSLENVLSKYLTRKVIKCSFLPSQANNLTKFVQKGTAATTCCSVSSSFSKSIKEIINNINLWPQIWSYRRLDYAFRPCRTIKLELGYSLHYTFASSPEEGLTRPF